MTQDYKKGMEILQQALHEAEEREDKLREQAATQKKIIDGIKAEFCYCPPPTSITSSMTCKVCHKRHSVAVYQLLDKKPVVTESNLYDRICKRADCTDDRKRLIAAEEYSLLLTRAAKEALELFDMDYCHKVRGPVPLLNLEEAIARSKPDTNQYTPWIELGLTELEYFKKRYLEARKREEFYQRFCNALHDGLVNGVVEFVDVVAWSNNYSKALDLLLKEDTEHQEEVAKLTKEPDAKD